MARRKRSRAQREADLVTIADRLERGESQTTLAADLQLSPSQICYDTAEVIERWRQMTNLDLNESRVCEWRKLCAVEREAWRRLETLPMDSPTAGGLLRRVLECVEARLKITGADDASRGWNLPGRPPPDDALSLLSR